MSSADASSSCGGQRDGLLAHVVGRCPTALPPSWSDREPPVPPPVGTSAVSDCSKRIVLQRDAEPVGDDHRERCRVTLAVGRRAGPDRDHAVVVHLDRAELRPADAGDLGVRRDADAQQPALARARGAPRCSARSASKSAIAQRLPQRQVVVAGVVGEPGQGVEGEGVGPDEVAAPDLDRVEAQLVGGDVDEALDAGGGLGPPGTAERPDRRGVGHRREPA